MARLLDRPETQFVLLLLALAAASVFVPHAEAQVLGSVSTVGPVHLRGVLISGEGTLFPNDSLEVPAGAYAKVLLATGARIELGDKSRLTLVSEGRGVQLVLDSGVLGFAESGSPPIIVTVAGAHVVGSGGAVGLIEYSGDEFASLEVLKDDVTVYESSESAFTLSEGDKEVLRVKQASAEAGLGESIAPWLLTSALVAGAGLGRPDVTRLEGAVTQPVVQPVSVLSERRARGVRHRKVKSGKRASPSKPSKKSEKSEKSEKSSKSERQELDRRKRSASS